MKIEIDRNTVEIADKVASAVEKIVSVISDDPLIIASILMGQGTEILLKCNLTPEQIQKLLSDILLNFPECNAIVRRSMMKDVNKEEK